MEESKWAKATIPGKKEKEIIEYNKEIYLRCKRTFLNSIKNLGKVTLKKEDIPKYLDLFNEDTNFSLLMFNDFSFEKEISFNKKELEDHADIKTTAQLKRLIKNLKNVAKESKGLFKPILVFISDLETLLRELELEKREKALEKKEKALEKKEKKGKYKRSGHLQDQLLKYSYPKDNKPDLFSILKEETIKEIDIREVERSEVVEGIKLTPSETKVIDCLCKLLHHNSQTLDSSKQDFYTGNTEAEITDYGNLKDTAPKLLFTLYELTKEYVGGEKGIGGNDVNNLKTILVGLSQKNFLIRYKEEIHHKGGKKVRELEMVNKIISLPTLRETDYSKEGIELSKTEETLVILHPIFKRQIDSKFILYPDDINQRTILAYGSSKVSSITLNLREYLMRLRASPKMSREITLDRLYYVVAEKWMRESRKAKVKRDLEKALDVVKKLGLLESYNITPSKTTGEPKIVFKLNKDFE